MHACTHARITCTLHARTYTTHAHTRIRIRTWACAPMHAYMYACTWASAHMYAHTYTHACERTHIHTCTHKRRHTHIRTSRHAYTHTSRASARFDYAMRFCFRGAYLQTGNHHSTHFSPSKYRATPFYVIFFSFFSRWLSVSYELFSLVLLLVVLLFVSFYIISSEHQTRWHRKGRGDGLKKNFR
jgi:hypothetical protein